MVKGLRLLLMISLTLVCVTNATRADLIRVQMEPNAAFDGRSPIGFSGVESSAASADPIFGSNGSNTWNHLSIAPAGTATMNPSFSNLLDSAGVPTGVGISFMGGITAASDAPLDNNGSDALENEYFAVNTAQPGTNSPTVGYSITGLAPNTTVAFYLYAPNFNHVDGSNPNPNGSRAYTLTANGISILVPTGPNDNALTFVTTDASGAISGTWSTPGGYEGDWSGFQIATVTVPEPGSLVLLGTGLLGVSLFGLRVAHNHGLRGNHRVSA